MPAPAPIDVLLVEDEALIRLLLAEVLEDEGLAVAELPDGEPLFASVPAVPAPPRVLVTDMGLGRGKYSGLEVAAQARRCWPGVGVVYVTGRPWNLEGHALDRRERFLPKPFLPSALVAAVLALIEV